MRGANFHMKYFIFAALVVLSAVAPVLPQSKADSSYNDFPQSGVLAAMGTLQTSNLSIPQLPMGMLNSVPLTGSLALDSKRVWQFTVENKTNRTIKVQYELMEFNADPVRVGSQWYQERLKPLSIDSESFPAKTNARGGALVLRSWQFVND